MKSTQKSGIGALAAGALLGLGLGVESQAVPGVPCPPEATVVENEPDCGQPVDTVNGGCSASDENLQRFTEIAPGDLVCGTMFSSSENFDRDTDWFRFTLAVPSSLAWDLTAEFPVTTALYRVAPTAARPCEPPLNLVRIVDAAPGETAELAPPPLPAGTYLIYVSDQGGGGVACGAPYRAELSTKAVSAPENDLCVQATPVKAFPAYLEGTTLLATVDPEAPACNGAVTRPAVWFRLTGTGNVIAVNACWYFDAYDAIGKVHVYRAGAGGCGDLSCVSTDVSGGACSFPFVFFPEWRFCAEAGAEYFILALPDSAEPGRFAISFMNEGSVGCSPRGACCLEGQACTFMTRVACEGLGGVYAGDGVACRPSAMAPPEIWNREVNGAIQYGLCPAGQGDTLTVDSTDFTLAGVEVGVVIPDHVNLGELGIEIEHNGVVVQLWEHVCAGSGSMDVMFSDSGGVVKCATPLVGTIRPMGSLAEFVGMGVGGDWTLRVCDAAPKNDGTLVSWSLVATPGTSECAPPTSCPGDANADGRIDGADLSVLLGQFGAGVPAGSGSDFNGDGAVNGADLSVLLGRFGGAC